MKFHPAILLWTLLSCLLVEGSLLLPWFETPQPSLREMYAGASSGGEIIGFKQLGAALSVTLSLCLLVPVINSIVSLKQRQVTSSGADSFNLIMVICTGFIIASGLIKDSSDPYSNFNDKTSFSSGAFIATGAYAVLFIIVVMCSFRKRPGDSLENS